MDSTFRSLGVQGGKILTLRLTRGFSGQGFRLSVEPSTTERLKSTDGTKIVLSENILAGV